MSFESLVIDSQIVNMREVHDYFQIQTNNCIISIYNPAYVLSNLSICRLADFPKEKIEGCTIVSAHVEEFDRITVELDNGRSIVVSLKEKDYRTPEAICASFFSGEIMAF